MNMKYLLLSLIILTGCSTSKTINKDKSTSSLKDDINESIVKGFYDGDTTGLSSDVYLLK